MSLWKRAKVQTNVQPRNLVPKKMVNKTHNNKIYLDWIKVNRQRECYRNMPYKQFLKESSEEWKEYKKWKEIEDASEE